MWIKGKWVKVEHTRACPKCGTEFTTTTQRKHCSDACKSTYNSAKHHSRHQNTLQYHLIKLLSKSERRNISLDSLEQMYHDQKGLCALSGEKMTYIHGNGRCETNISLDRIKAGGPYLIDNVRLVCATVNTMRSDMSDDTLYEWCQRILDARKIK